MAGYQFFTLNATQEKESNKQQTIAKKIRWHFFEQRSC